MTTATPRGLIASWTAIAICFVSRSWTCSRREKVSAIRASLEMPSTSLLGMYAIATCKQCLSERECAETWELGGERKTDLASEWYEVVLAETGNVDVPHNDHFVVVLRKHRVVNDIYRISGQQAIKHTYTT